MKAEHRKELHTNLLADRMGRLVEGVRSGQGPKSAIIWVIAGLALITVLGWYVADRAAARSGAAWVSLSNSETSPSALAAVDDAHPGTLAGRTARFQRARLLLRSGLDSIYSNASLLPDYAELGQSNAATSLDEARRLFRDLISECYDEPILQQEALMGAAKAEETLVGVPQSAQSQEPRGSLDEALKLYRRLADTYGATDLGRQAAARVQELEDHRADVEQFYSDLRTAAHRKLQLRSPSLDQ
jgi:hypothetical protein